LLSLSVEDWLSEGHLVWFVVEMVGQINLRSLKDSYAGHGSKTHSPVMLTTLLFYGYATGVFSSRKSVAFRYITANTYPDHAASGDVF